MKPVILLALFGITIAHPNISKKALVPFGPIKTDGILSQTGKITGGYNATVGEFPWQVSIQVTPLFGEKYHTCGGSILNDNHVITAAHCVEGQVLDQLSIVAGAHNIKETEPSQQVRSLERIAIHELFDLNVYTHDIAILTLASPLEFNVRVQSMGLAPEGFVPGGECVTSGWGNANPSGGTPAIIPDQLQKVTLGIVERAECEDSYAFINQVDETMVCAGGGEAYNQGACTGDSGSPLICKDTGGNDVLQGLVSWGLQPCGQYEYPTVFGNIAAKAMRDFVIREGSIP